MFNVYINHPPPPPPPPHQKRIVSSSRRTHSAVVARATVSSDRNYLQKTVERATTDRYIEIIPYDGSRGSDYQRVQKVLDKLGGVKSWQVNMYGKLTVSTVQHPDAIINALKHEFSSNRRITISQTTDHVSSKSNVSFQDKAILQAMGTMVATHASQGLIKSIEYKETTTKEGTKTKGVKVNYVDRDGGTSTSRSAPRVHNQAHTGRHTTTSKEITRSKETTRSYY